MDIDNILPGAAYFLAARCIHAGKPTPLDLRNPGEVLATARREAANAVADFKHGQRDNVVSFVVASLAIERGAPRNVQWLHAMDMIIRLPPAFKHTCGAHEFVSARWPVISRLAKLLIESKFISADAVSWIMNVPT
jgi:hypothetical protein